MDVRRNLLVSLIAFVALVALLAISASSAPRSESRKNDSRALEADIMKLEKDSWEAWKARDGKFYENFLSADHVELGSAGPADKRTVVQVVASPACVVKSYSLSDIKVTAFSETTVVVTYRAEQDTLCNKVQIPSPVWISSLYIRRDGRWLNALFQQSEAAKTK